MYVDESRTFFCSELIAKAFKVLGVIEDDEKSCATFFPQSFSSKGGQALKMMPGMQLGPELNIVVKLNPRQSEEEQVRDSKRDSKRSK